MAEIDDDISALRTVLRESDWAFESHQYSTEWQYTASCDRISRIVAHIDAQAAEIERLKAALLWTLWRSQGGSSTIEQPLRRVLGIRKFEALTPEQIECAKRFGEQQ